MCRSMLVTLSLGQFTCTKYLPPGSLGKLGKIDYFFPENFWGRVISYVCRQWTCTQSRSMTTFENNPSNELQSVPANLTLHMMSKIEFQPEFRNPQMLSFPKMYNTMGSKMDGLREHFLSKNAEKTAFLAARFSDHLTSERSSTHNFKD